MASSNPPQAGQWFYIQSPLSDSYGNTYVVNIEAANASPGAQIILWPLQPNSYNALWKYENGNIVSPLTAPGIPFLVLDSSVSSTNSVALNSRTGSSSQQWTFNDDGTITNQSNGFVLDIAGGAAQSWASLVTNSAAQGSSASQQWSIVHPQVFVPTWSYIQSGLTEDQSNPLVATVQEGTSDVVLSSVQAASANQLWQITPDGRILSATAGNPVMTLGSPLSGGENGNYIITAPSPAQTNNTLQWIFNDQNMFINASNGLALNVQGSSPNQNTPLITYAVQSGPPTPNEVWSMSPASTMTDIMALPPTPVPAFPGDQETAYTTICQQLVPPLLPVPDLRSQYTNNAVNLSPYLSQILNMPCPPPPSGVQQADWNADWNTVVSQLTEEITAAMNIQALFSNYFGFHTAMFADKGVTLAKLITDAGMDQGSNKKNVSGIVLSVFEGVFYTALEAVPGGKAATKVCAVLGNVMSEGINVGMSVANKGGGSISPDPFQVAVSDLEGQLSGNFQALLTAMSNMEETILTDWGKMQATYRAIFSTGPDSLAWPSNLTASLVTNAMPGYTISIMQMLLPTKYQIFQYQANDDSDISNPPANPPANAQWVQPIGNNTWNKYWIATPGNWTEYPSNEALEDVWNAGVTKSDFFQGLAKWGFARCYPSIQGSSIGVGYNGLVITITSQTPNPLTVNASPNNNQGITVNYPSSQTLQPYGSVTFIGYYTNALAIDITITDPNLAGADSVASFTAHQHNCGVEAKDTWVDPPSTSMGYQLTNPICNPGSLANSFPGTVQIGICQAPINDQSSS